MLIKKNRKDRKSQGSRVEDLCATIILLLVSCCCSLTSNAQCAMCRAAIEGEGNVAIAQSVNNGIVFLMVIPYLLVGGLAYGIYRLRKAR